MILNAYASSSHYAEHIDAVWSHLPPDLAGVRYSASGRAWPGWQPAGRGRPPLGEPVLVAGYSDVIVMAPRPYVYLEHGAGQSYGGGDGRRARDGSYAGGDGHDRAVLFLCPSETVADRWRARYPATLAVAVGCPSLDLWHEFVRCGGVLPISRWRPGVVSDALLAMEAARRPIGDVRDLSPDYSGTAFAPHEAAWTGRMLALAGVSPGEWLSAVQSRRQGQARSSGVVDDRPRRAMAGEGDRPHLSQPGPLVSGGVPVPPSTVHEPRPSRFNDTGRESAALREHGPGPTVAVTFHWDCPLVPETRTAWPHYDDALPALAAHLEATGGRLLGHGHPRLWGAIERRWRRLGVECVPRFADVLDRADLLVADNTSALYEFASTGRPVLTLNAPWYRRDVEHGLRFWDAIPGLAIDHPANLIEAVQIAAADPPPIAAIRRAAVAHAYAHVDGSAGSRAATAVEETLSP